MRTAFELLHACDRVPRAVYELRDLAEYISEGPPKHNLVAAYRFYRPVYEAARDFLLTHGWEEAPPKENDPSRWSFVRIGPYLRDHFLDYAHSLRGPPGPRPWPRAPLPNAAFHSYVFLNLLNELPFQTFVDFHQ